MTQHTSFAITAYYGLLAVVITGLTGVTLAKGANTLWQSREVSSLEATQKTLLNEKRAYHTQIAAAYSLSEVGEVATLQGYMPVSQPLVLTPAAMVALR